MVTLEPARIAVPGCGRGHDCRLLASRGYRVWGFDFAEAAVTEARRLASREGVSVAVERRDVFTLDKDYRGFFDGVWEYTCFCAIDPARREEYVQIIHAILRPGGRLLACFYPLREGTDGPPFPVSRPEIERVLASKFRILQSGPPGRSVERRQGLEWLVLAERPESQGGLPRAPVGVESGGASRTHQGFPQGTTPGLETGGGGHTDEEETRWVN